MPTQNRRKFIKKMGAATIGYSLLAGLPSCKNSESSTAILPFEKLPRSTAEQQGISSLAIKNFLDAVDASEEEFHGFIMMRNGHVISEAWWSPFQSSYLHTLYSLSKSFTSTAIGMLVDDKKIMVEDQLISFFPDDLPEVVSDHLKAMKLKHLLTMNTGHAEGTTSAMFESEDSNWVKAFLAQEVVHEPSTHFLYNTGATYMLSAIVQKVSGQTVHDFLSERLFKPLNITGTDWEKDPNGVDVGGWGLRARLEHIANFGQLYLQEGQWNGQQIISPNWVKEATAKQTTSQENESDWGQGYGYQFWRCKPEPGFYRGDGAFGQYCIVIPQYQTVIAINSESKDMQASMNLVWDHLLPEFSESEKTLKENPSAQNTLKEKISTLKIPVLKGQEASKLAQKIAGQNFQLEANGEKAKSVQFSFENNQCTISLNKEDGLELLQCGKEKWIVNGDQRRPTPSILGYPGYQPVASKYAASYTWTDDKTMQVQLKFLENMHTDNWTFEFDKGQVNISFKHSIAAMRNDADERENWLGKV